MVGCPYLNQLKGGCLESRKIENLKMCLDWAGLSLNTKTVEIIQG